jgi:hypothetical protein
MYIVILFGGGDGGGIIITSRGIKRIPPWDPTFLDRVYALNHLLQAGRLDTEIGELVGRKAGALAEEVSRGVVEQVGAVDSDIGGSDGAFAFFDVDGGFVCGSTGKPPIPIPPKSDFGFDELGVEGFG